MNCLIDPEAQTALLWCLTDVEPRFVATYRSVEPGLVFIIFDCSFVHEVIEKKASNQKLMQKR